MNERDSYDDKQAHAPLVTCPSCGSEVYATDGDRPDWLCRVCRAKAEQTSTAVVRPLRKHCGVVMTLLELPDYYDGGLYWVCESCGGWAHRFPVGHVLWSRAVDAVKDGCLDPALEIDAR